MAILENGRPSDTVDRRVYPIRLVREAHDGADHSALLHNPSDEDAKLDIALDESFPTSDAPGHSRPGTSDPAPSSGYDYTVETAILRTRRRKAAAWTAGKIGLPLIAAGALIGYVGLRLLSGAAEDSDADSFGVGA